MANTDLHLRTNEPLLNPTAEQNGDATTALPLLQRGEDPQLQFYLRRIAEEERGALIETFLRS